MVISMNNEHSSSNKSLRIKHYWYWRRSKILITRNRRGQCWYQSKTICNVNIDPMEKIDDVDNEIMLVAVFVVECRPLTCHSLAVARVNTGFAFTLALSMHWVHLTSGCKHIKHIKQMKNTKYIRHFKTTYVRKIESIKVFSLWANTDFSLTAKSTDVL